MLVLEISRLYLICSRSSLKWHYHDPRQIPDIISDPVQYSIGNAGPLHFSALLIRMLSPMRFDIRKHIAQCGVCHAIAMVCRSQTFGDRIIQLMAEKRSHWNYEQKQMLWRET